MPSYEFPNSTAAKLIALDAYIRKNINWADDFEGLFENPISVQVSRELTTSELTALTTLVESYTDPAYFLNFNHTENLALHSHFTTDFDNVVIDNKNILQTFIFSNRNNNGLVLDSCKTIVEYNCPNVQNFANTTSGSINLGISDVTRGITITEKTIDISNIASQWNTLAQTGSTSSSTIFTSTSFEGLMNKTTGYDCIWQLVGNVSDSSKFTFRLNGLQFLFYDVV
jgi:hypothetical protein